MSLRYAVSVGIWTDFSDAGSDISLLPYFQGEGHRHQQWKQRRAWLLMMMMMIIIIIDIEMMVHP
jgi:hypothetical protein